MCSVKKVKKNFLRKKSLAIEGLILYYFRPLIKNREPVTRKKKYSGSAG
jgi:hypothetical protein